ncbi:hypothetical protein [Mesorhizobium sp. NPDC059025]|uniref:hypothetical protein n=1 Tax=unclassified Mesorhizobium TaxID=325217 RepID=UPI0036811B3F
MAEEPTLPPVMTPKMLADAWHCSERHIRNLIESGELKAFKLGEKLLRITTNEAELFRQRNSTSAKEAATLSSSPTEVEQDQPEATISDKKRRKPAAPRLDLLRRRGPKF